MKLDSGIPFTVNGLSKSKWFLPASFVLSKTGFVKAAILFFIAVLSITPTVVSARQTQPAEDSSYTKLITERAAKIVNTLKIADSSKYKKVQAIIADQYRALNTIHDNSKKTVAVLKAQQYPDKAQLDSVIKKEETQKNALLLQQHDHFIDQLKTEISIEQIELVKDGMTYNVLNVTYNAYQQMLPDLTKEQKEKIYNWLVEAREFAMDAESSKKKHAWFGKYKGRINNYLSGMGIDMKKAGEDWEARRKAAAATKTDQ